MVDRRASACADDPSAMPHLRVIHKEGERRNGGDKEAGEESLIQRSEVMGSVYGWRGAGMFSAEQPWPQTSTKILILILMTYNRDDNMSYNSL